MRDFSIFLTPEIKIKRKKGGKTKILLTIFLLSFIALVFYLPKKQNEKAPKTSPQIKEEEKMPTKNVPQILSREQLLEEINKIVENAGGTYSVYIYDLKKKQGFGINSQMVITGASVNKTAILASLYHLAGKKEIDLEKIIVLQKEDIQDYGTGSIRYNEPGTPYSLKALARLMMEKSDNTAAYILGSHILGPEKVQKLINFWGLTQTEIAENKTSTSDMALLFTKIYQGEITSKPLTLEMLDFMDKSDFEDRIPKGVEEGIKVYHKTGDEVGKIHDVGIVDLPSNPYYLGIMSTDTTNDEAAKETLSQISHLVFLYMKNL